MATPMATSLKTVNTPEETPPAKTWPSRPCGSDIAPSEALVVALPVNLEEPQAISEKSDLNGRIKPRSTRILVGLV